jgi:hypothetical protein
MSAVAAAACGGGEARPEAAAIPPAQPATAAAAPAAAEPSAPAVEPRKEVASRPARQPRREPARPAPVAPRASAPASAATTRADEYQEIVVPAGAVLPLELRSALASDVSQVEDSVRAVLRAPLSVNGRDVLPRGTEIVGSVLEAERAGRVKGRARIAFHFTSLRYDSEVYRVRSEAIEREGEATKGEDATKIGVGAGAGAALGALLGGGKGAAKGAAIGAAAGTGVVMATRGHEVRLEPGEPVEARLAAPLAIRVRMR